MHFWGHYIMNLLENMDHELWESKNVIYCYTNKINGKRYVGQTVQKLKNRHCQHISATKFKSSHHDNFSPIHRAMRKYGIENFKLEILHIADKYSIDMLEIYCISYFNTLVKNEKGYNVSSGGSNGSIYKGKSEQELKEMITKQVNSRKLAWANRTPEEEASRIKKIRETRLKNPDKYKKFGKENHFYGKQHKDETKKYLSEVQKERYKNMSKEEKEVFLNILSKYHKKGAENLRAKKVVAIDVQNYNVIEFDYVGAVKEAGFCPTNVSVAASKKMGSFLNIYKGYKWYYYDEYCDLTQNGNKIDISAEELEYVKKTMIVYKSVIGISINNPNNKLFYDKVMDSRDDGFNSASIHKCCRGEAKKHKGYIWYYKEDYDKLTDEEIKLEISLISNRRTRRTRRTSISRSVVGISLEDNNKKLFYDAIIQATEHGFDNSAISKCCNGKYSSHKGYKWYYKEDYDKMIAETN